MKIVTSIMEAQSTMLKYKKEGKSIGYVPTMGYLHEGHTTLIDQARSENDIVAISIFVNPLQFGPTEDLSTYPRDFERDCKLAEAHGADVVFYPSPEEMYPHEPAIAVKVGERTDVLCGKSRPGHFDGVATVLIKLFNIIQADRAYFGMKDAQQVAVVDSIVEHFNIPVTIVPVGTVRETDGLAKSSRNVYLLPEERVEAAAIHASLKKAKQAIIDGERDPEKVLSLVKGEITSATSGEIDYAEIYAYPELTQLQHLSGTFIIAVAVKFSKARLIDNLVLTV